MDPVYTVLRRFGSKGQSLFEWPSSEGIAICSISNRNTVAFTSVTELDDITGKTWKAHVFVADLNIPWETHLVMSHSEIINYLEWDVSGSKLLITDSNGEIQMWAMKDYLLNEWSCLTTASFSGEHILCAAWFHHGKKMALNIEKKDAFMYMEKFTPIRFGPSIRYFGGRPREGCLAVSITGVVCVVILQSDGTTITSSESLGSLRSRLKVVDLCYGKNGDFLVAASDGVASSAIQCYKVTLRLQQEKCVITSQALPSFYSNCYLTSGSAADKTCTRVTHLRFVIREAADAIVVCTAGNNDSIVELWELREKQIPLHKMFLSQSMESKLKTVCWQHHASARTPSQVVALTTPRTSIYDSNPPPSYILAAYQDSTIKCFYRESLHLVCSITINPSVYRLDDAGVKLPGSATLISDMQLTWTGSALLTIDSLSQLYLYRLSPITDPGGPVSPNYAVTLLEYCMMTGVDWLDILLGLKPGMIEQISEKMSETFNRQPPGLQQYYLSRFLAIKMTIYRCLSTGHYKAGDCYSLLMLNAVANCFKSVLRPTDLSSLDKGPAENLTAIMTSKQHSETTDVDKVILNFEKNKEFCVEPATLQSLQQLIQWVANFTLYLLASLPQQYHNMIRYPGGGLLADHKALSTLRELLVVIRFWGLIRHTCLPVFTKTSENLDVVSLLFKLLTRTLLCQGSEPDENLLDECCLLPSQVLVPKLYLATEAAGVTSPSLALNSLPLSFEYNCEPEFMQFVHEPIMLEGSIPAFQKYDVVRHIYMGSNPSIYKQCTRCSSVSMVKVSPKSSATRAWDQRWARACPCGGHWKLVKSST